MFVNYMTYLKMSYFMFSFPHRHVLLTQQKINKNFPLCDFPYTNAIIKRKFS